jgi:hypothetical protein
MKTTLSDIRRIIAEELELFEQGGDPTVFELVAGTKVIPVYHDVDGDQLLYVNVAGNRTNIRISKYEEGGMPVRGYFQLGDEIVRGDLREPRSTYRPDTPGDWDDPEEWHESKTPEIEEGHNKWDPRNIVLKHRGKLDVTAGMSDEQIATLDQKTLERYASQITSHPAIKGEYTALGEDVDNIIDEEIAAYMAEYNMTNPKRPLDVEYVMLNSGFKPASEGQLSSASDLSDGQYEIARYYDSNASAGFVSLAKDVTGKTWAKTTPPEKNPNKKALAAELQKLGFKPWEAPAGDIIDLGTNE